jgi:hypothetical protein
MKLLEIISADKKQYEVYDTKTGNIAGGPYNSLARANLAVDRLDAKYGGYRYRYREITDKNKVSEAVHKLPLTEKDFENVKDLMSKPIPAIMAHIYLNEIIDDDELRDQIKSIEDVTPSRDVRSLIFDWIKRVMPDEMYRFTDDIPSMNQRKGLLSPIHGYDPKFYRGTNDPITGNAYGRR